MALRGSASTTRNSRGRLKGPALAPPARQGVKVGRPVRPDDEGDHGLAPLGRGEADHGDLATEGWRPSTASTSAGYTLWPPGDDELGPPAADGEVAVVGHRGQVAGGEPPVAHMALAWPRAAPNSRGRATGRAPSARRCRRSSASATHGLDPGQRKPDRTRAALAHQRDWTGSAASRTCRSAPAPTRRARVEALPQVGRERGRSRDAEAQRRQLAGPPGLGQPVVHGGDAEEHGAAAATASSTAPGSNRSKTMAEAPAASVPKSPAHSPCTWNSGRARMRRSSGCQPQAEAERLHAGQQRAVGVDGALGLPGRPRGVDDRARRRRAGPHRGGRRRRDAPASAQLGRARTAQAGSTSVARRPDAPRDSTTAADGPDVVAPRRPVRSWSARRD